MKQKIVDFGTAYRNSLRERLAGAGELALHHGYQLGRQAIKNGLGVEDMLIVQQSVLDELIGEARTVEDCAQLMKSSQELFAECLAPFELTHRGFLDIESLNRKLEAANKELESFTYSVSHDLRAPLRAIDGYSRMILKKGEKQFDEEMLKLFHVIRQNVKTMSCLIDDLLALSRLGKQEMSKTNLDMEEIVKDVWHNLLTVNPERNMTIDIAKMHPGTGDRSLIREVLSNLLGNAVKFTRNCDVARIEVGSLVKDGETVYYVRDNGIGFEMKYHDKLFSVFQRLHPVNEYEGTGVGLAIVDRVIRRNGGRVWAEGKVGEGATFYFTLPTEQK